MPRYYGRVQKGGYAFVVKLDGPKSYVWGAKDSGWVEDDYFSCARFDITDYDEITEAEAKAVIRNYKK